jgi:hypothetical protein
MGNSLAHKKEAAQPGGFSWTSHGERFVGLV